MSNTTTAPITLTNPRTLSSTRSVFASLLRADLTTQWRNRRATVMVFILPVIILFAWKPLIKAFGGPFILANCITIGLNAVGIMGYSNSIARDRDKGIFQRLRVSPAPNWTIMVSRLTVQLVLISIMTLFVFIGGYQYDHIALTAGGYVASFFTSLACGAVYLALGQAIVGRITNPETVNATSRLIYLALILIGMFGSLGMLGNAMNKIVDYSPYGTVKTIVTHALVPSTWNADANLALLITLGYTVVFAYLGIKWFKWNSR
ncbi:MAG TPA: ABC transporter permease [Puia sp.]|jgi:ABC-2 type transport system permease protein|nr:ABC transporter permease [Puia sp.]